ncbi:hypothetical protein ACF061_13915 [Streptomyces sp. NPDC015220]|uniref:hypothetical protein n=1 Tax=Streptomyces sp. NPDC015220 TaxID=3364947 RepID=UPI0036F4D95E
MRIRGRQGRGLRLTAVLAATVLALTGFSRGHGHSSHSGGGGGGGCSSSHQDHDGSSSSSGGNSTSGGGSYTSATPEDDPYGDDYADSSGTSSGTTSGGSYNRRPTHRSSPSPSGTGSSDDLSSGEAKLVSCATEKAPYATVEVTNPNDSEARFTAYVEFQNAKDELVSYHSAEVTVPANGKARARVQLGDGASRVDDLIQLIDHCEADPRAPVDED